MRITNEKLKTRNLHYSPLIKCSSETQKKFQGGGGIKISLSQNHWREEIWGITELEKD